MERINVCWHMHADVPTKDNKRVENVIREKATRRRHSMEYCRSNSGGKVEGRDRQNYALREIERKMTKRHIRESEGRRRVEKSEDAKGLFTS